jgi:hypothetical protein
MTAIRSRPGPAELAAARQVFRRDSIFRWVTRDGHHRPRIADVLDDQVTQVIAHPFDIQVGVAQQALHPIRTDLPGIPERRKAHPVMAGVTAVVEVAIAALGSGLDLAITQRNGAARAATGCERGRSSWPNWPRRSAWTSRSATSRLVRASGARWSVGCFHSSPSTGGAAVDRLPGHRR